MRSRQSAYQHRYYQTVTKPKRRSARSNFAGVTCVTLSSKGQFTIPAAIRRQLGLHPVDRVEIHLHGTDAFELRTLPKDERRAPKQGGEGTCAVSTKSS